MVEHEKREKKNAFPNFEKFKSLKTHENNNFFMTNFIGFSYRPRRQCFNLFL